MKKSILIIGLGKFGIHMAEKFLENGHEVMAIDRSEARADAASGLISQILIGDATDERFMKSIGVSDFDMAVIAIADDFLSALEITVLLKDLGCKFILARASSDNRKRLLLRNGADYVSYAERETAERLAVIYADDNVFNYIELTPEVGIYEVSVPPLWIGKTLVELDIRNRFSVSILATKENGQVKPLPSAQYKFKGAETIMVMGTMENVEKLNRKKQPR